MDAGSELPKDQPNPERPVSNLTQEKNRAILRSIFENGILAPHGVYKRGQKTFSSNTSSERTPTVVGNIFNPTLDADYDQDKDEVTLKIKENENVLFHRQGGRFFPPKYYYQGFIDLQEGKDTQRSQLVNDLVLDQALYYGWSAVLPVMAERPWIIPDGNFSESNQPYRDLKESECVARMQASILAVADLKDIKKMRKEMSVFNLPSLTSGPLEYLVEKGVPFEGIKYLIVPAHLKEEIEKIFPEEIIKQKVRFVENTKKDVSVYKWWKEMQVPDYEGALRQLTDENPGEQFWIHGIRLTIPTDIWQEEKWEEYKGFERDRKKVL
ncbi:MAG: hypothetical protein A3D74_05205 [Candidatus Levybacteria bacterium RIFCSPHIGHO2_02_FULL_37_13]|nr:MAG: hypothetical protein A3D74_05205 [Candidatus Levybacteria bacterium RIFCSPHIGHO2_02_FULL_37_13]OGH29058.1 MAG: hypothetical protein A3E40_02725 [Candidatus Levybacteria bacterium RIFCSPHIGHO2_12_FULL_37_9]OGH39719.1 MAG: hypothetical protein A3B41_00705 [Candidatus Levybacteria bacterium RIFCSPLOWO2_01_FULL_37_26]